MFLARLVTLFGSLALDVPGKRPKGRRGQRWLETLHVNLLDEVASPHQKSAPRHHAGQTLMKMMNLGWLEILFRSSIFGLKARPNSQVIRMFSINFEQQGATKSNDVPRIVPGIYSLLVQSIRDQSG